MTPKSIDVIFDLDIQRPFDEEIDREAEIAFYRSRNEGVISILKIQKLDSREYNFSYCEVGQTELTEDASGDQALDNNFEDIKSFGDITLKNGQVRSI